MTILKVQSDDSNDTFRFALETALVVAGIAAVTAVAKPLAKHLFERNLPNFERGMSARVLLRNILAEDAVENAYMKSRVFASLIAPLGAAAGEALYQKSSSLFLGEKSHYDNTFTVGFWGLVASIDKTLVPLCNSGIAITTALAVGVLSLAYYCHSESDANHPSIARDMGIAFFIGFATSAALRGRWALVG